MKSKVKVIAECKDYTNDFGTTHYHNLEMENGDKVNIGKKKKLAVGDELEYEFIGELGQHEYTKAKTPKPEQQSFPSGGKSDSVQKYIIRQSSLTRAIEHLSHKDHDQMTKENITALADYYSNWVLKG
jgi:hypothetical protein